MFKFDFNVNDIDEELSEFFHPENDLEQEDKSTEYNGPSLVISTVEDLIGNLPPLISYSPLPIPLINDGRLTLLRRDLFDARFQLISEPSTAETLQDLDFIDAPSDLLPGVYEGGLKTWECSTDLAAYLESVNIKIADKVHNILEVGCGTAIPSLYLLHRMFHERPEKGLTETARTTLHVQDYNLAVLQLVTLPNIILTWYASPASESYRTAEDSPLPGANISEPGELALTPDLLSAFTDSLKKRNMELLFISGSWFDTDHWLHEHRLAYDLVITSETIYSPTSLPSLINLLKSSSTSCGEGENGNGTPSDEFAQLSLRSAKSTICLVAAKVIYFGVGGGMDGFEKAVREIGGRTETIMERKGGVNRRITQVVWQPVEST